MLQQFHLAMAEAILIREADSQDGHECFCG
jgi:hypothetical protein